MLPSWIKNRLPLSTASLSAKQNEELLKHLETKLVYGTFLDFAMGEEDSFTIMGGVTVLKYYPPTEPLYPAQLLIEFAQRGPTMLTFDVNKLDFKVTGRTTHFCPELCRELFFPRVYGWIRQWMKREGVWTHLDDAWDYEEDTSNDEKIKCACKTEREREQKDSEPEEEKDLTH